MRSNVEIVEDLHRRGAQAVILGCTEIALLIQQHDTDVPLYDTTKNSCRAGGAACLNLRKSNDE